MTREELCLVMLLAEWASLLMRPAISETMVSRAEVLIKDWQRLVFDVHPSMQGIPNLHFISHLVEDIRNFGPVYGYWNFALEQVNKLLKNINTNGHVGMELSIYNSFLEFGVLEPLLHRLEAKAHGALQTDAAREFVTLYRTITADSPAANAFSESFWESQSRDLNKVRLKKGKVGYLDASELIRLKDALSTTHGFNYVRYNEPGWEQRPDAFKLGLEMTSHVQVEYERRRFMPIDNRALREASVTKDVRVLKDCLFELRDDRSVFNCVNKREPVYLITKIFTHQHEAVNRQRMSSAECLMVKSLLPTEVVDHTLSASVQ